MTFRRDRTKSTRAGMTLVELLVVLMIVSLLILAAVPLMRNNLEGRKIREASRGMNMFIAGAKARAAELGRPVGVWIERRGDVFGTDDSRQSLQVFMAEVPPPYAGDTLDARAILIDAHLPGPDGVWGTAANDDNFGAKDDLLEAGWPGSDDYVDGVPETALIPILEGQFLPTLAAVGDFIRFGYKGDLYRIVGFPADVPAGYVGLTFAHPDTVWSKGADGAAGRKGVNDDGFGQTDDFAEAGWPRSDDVWLSPPGPGRPFARVPFQVLRKPSRALAGSFDLPTGTAIDLALSGYGSSGVQFAPSDATIASSPVLIMFNPTGNVDQVYIGGVAFRPTHAIHLLIAQSEFVGQMAGGQPANLADPLNSWISIGHKTGRITVTENAGLDVATTLTAAIAEARKFARGAQRMGGQ